MWLDSDGVRSWGVVLFPLPFHSQTTEKSWKFCHDGMPLLWEFTELANSFSAKEFVTTSLGLIWALHQKLKSQYSICSFWPFWCPYLWPWINKDMEKQNEPNSNLVSICNVSLKALIQAFLLLSLKMQPWLKYCKTVCNIPENVYGHPEQLLK